MKIDFKRKNGSATIDFRAETDQDRGDLKKAVLESMPPMQAMKQPSPTKLLERDIQRQIKDFLLWRSWRIVRHQVAVATSGASTFSTGEKGMADLQAIYYFTGRPAHTLTLWIETKRLGKPLRPEQIAWREKEEARGAVVWRADSLECFMEAYERDFGWLHTRDGVKGQKMMEFEPVSK